MLSPDKSEGAETQEDTNYSSFESAEAPAKPIPMYKDWKLITIFGASFLTNAVYSDCAPFLPLKFEEMGVTKHMTKTIYAIMAISRVIGAMLVGKSVHKMHTKNGITICLFTIAFTIGIFGLLDYVKNPTFLGWAALILRIIEGFFTGILLTLSFATITNDYPDRKDRLMAITFCGFSASPALGETLYL
jgi:MFS family permease